VSGVYFSLVHSLISPFCVYDRASYVCGFVAFPATLRSLSSQSHHHSNMAYSTRDFQTPLQQEQQSAASRSRKPILLHTYVHTHTQPHTHTHTHTHTQPHTHTHTHTTTHTHTHTHTHTRPHGTRYLIPTLAKGTGCAGGQFINRTSNLTAPCLPGYFCPVTLPCLIRCTSGAFCNFTHIDSQSWQEPPCPQKSYCPEAVQQLTCPTGYFCPEAVEYPSRCNAFMVCPSGTGNPSINFTGLVVVGVMAFGMLIGLAIYQNRHFFGRIRAWCRAKSGAKRRRRRPTAVADLVKLKLFRMSRPGSVTPRHFESQ
jgi:hypothetical protein